MSHDPQPGPRGRSKRARRPGPKSTAWTRIRANFLTGFVVIAPIVVTVYLTWAFITFVDGQIVPLVPAPYNPRTYIDTDIPGFGVVVFLLFTTVVGYFAKKVFGKQIIRLGEAIVDRLPLVRSVYNAMKQIVETVLSQSGTSFSRACLIEYPRRDLWAVAFVSTETRGEILEHTGHGEMISVFLPTTPNPTSGFLLFVPRKDVVFLDMTVEEAAKLIISAGLVTPPTRAEIEAEARRTQARKAALAKAAAPPPPREGSGV
ncbi:MAG: DUF502 domain-containing protein [Pseudomonadota bacterium]